MNDQDVFLLCLAIAIACSALLGWAVGSARGRGAFGFTVGLLFGPLGLILVLILPAATTGRRCPFCQGTVPSTAILCMHCGKDLGQRIPSVRDNPFS